MDLEFGSRQLQQRAESLNEAIRAWGEPVARRYLRRVTEIRAARDFEDLRALRSLRVHPLQGARNGDWSMNLLGRWRLIFRIDLPLNRIRLEEVTNHYGD